ncbi:single-stranded-DNA-specific exonuclease RecJ [Candidatus Electrothrix sp.]|uniref:single-stranded-DNA-specific exonuclease RecJ n=1 Tax=Candidatus Electrothrix sp. TaxID=2170559 RepID=UPI0040559C98
MALRREQPLYIFPSSLPPAEIAISQKLAGHLGLPQIIGELLYRRGWTNPEKAALFLSPQLAELPSPTGLKGLDGAVDLLAQTIQAGQQVVIHGDYDVDGITATVLLTDFLAKLGIEAIWHLPNRLTDDYGLTIKSVAGLAKKVCMPALMITVDCGITCAEEVAYAKKLGFRVIITDHHRPPSDPARMPQADAVINPQQTDCTFAYKGLSGVGVAFFLITALRRKMVEQGVWTQKNMPNLRDSLDLVALGTVADVMPLTGLNRIIVRAGLEVLAEQRRPGIQALCKVTRIGQGMVTAEDIAFQLAPRINAAGRLGTPELAAELLLCTKNNAKDLAQELEQANLYRRELEAAVLDEATRQAEKQLKKGMETLVLYGRNWHLGVIGIIASRMVDRFQLPALVFTGDTLPSSTEEGEITVLKGSGRSVPGLNLHQALELCQEQILRFGGHAMAAGLTVRQDAFADFRDLFDQQVQTMERNEQDQGIKVDAVLDDQQNCRDILRGLQQMEPFGEGNPEPVFLARNIQLEDVHCLREHLKFSVRLNGTQLGGIGFFMAEQQAPAVAGRVDLAFRLKESCFRGKKRIDVRAVAVSPADCKVDYSSR